MSLKQYARFLVIGGIVGLVSCRELMGRMLIADSRAGYSLSVILAYVMGIALSFFLNRRHTFAQSDKALAGYSNFPLFALIALLGAACTWVLSLLLRYGTHLNALLGDYAAAVAFALAAVLATVVTYPLNARFVFKRG